MKFQPLAHGLYNESVHRKKQHTRGINTIPKESDFNDIGNFELGIRPYSFATAVFTKLGSLLSGTSRHCSVLVAPDVSGHDHFGTRHFGTY